MQEGPVEYTQFSDENATQQSSPYLSPQPYQAPQQPYQTDAPYYGQPAPQQPWDGTTAKDDSTLFIILSVLEICFAGGLFGIIPLVFSIMYKSALDAGDMIGAEKNRRYAKISLIVIICVMAALALIAFILLMVFGVAALSSLAAAG